MGRTHLQALMCSAADYENFKFEMSVLILFRPLQLWTAAVNICCFLLGKCWWSESSSYTKWLIGNIFNIDFKRTKCHIFCFFRLLKSIVKEFRYFSMSIFIDKRSLTPKSFTRKENMFSILILVVLNQSSLYLIVNNRMSDTHRYFFIACSKIVWRGNRK